MFARQKPFKHIVVSFWNYIYVVILLLKILTSRFSLFSFQRALSFVCGLTPGFLPARPPPSNDPVAQECLYIISNRFASVNYFFLLFSSCFLSLAVSLSQLSYSLPLSDSSPIISLFPFLSIPFCSFFQIFLSSFNSPYVLTAFLPLFLTYFGAVSGRCRAV
jgi:hypothetical protein